MNDFVLDGSVMLAYLHAEPGRQRVESLLLEEHCLLLSVNLAEVMSRLADWGVPLAEADERLAGLELERVPFDHSLARQAAQLRPPTRHLGLSLADRACLALAEARCIPAVTADRPWVEVGQAQGIQIVCIR